MKSIAILDAAARGNRFQSGRLDREYRTVAAMIRIHCRGRHGVTAGETLCRECAELLAYAEVRLGRCRFGAGKPTCSNCPVHCYQPVRREQIKDVMRYAGPRMLGRHPWLALRHWLDGFRRVRQRLAP